MTPEQAARAIADLDLEDCVALTCCGSTWAELCRRVFEHRSLPTLRTAPSSSRAIEMRRAAIACRVARALEAEARHRQHPGPVHSGADFRFPPASGDGVAAVTLAEAAAFVTRHHRHHRAPRGGRASIGLRRGGALVGVAILGRPVARGLDDGRTIEVTRLCVLAGARHAASELLGAAARLGRALGYERVITYTLREESGISLRAAGWKISSRSPGGGWSRAGRARADAHPTGPKVRWERTV